MRLAARLVAGLVTLVVAFGPSPSWAQARTPLATEADCVCNGPASPSLSKSFLCNLQENCAATIKNNPLCAKIHPSRLRRCDATDSQGLAPTEGFEAMVGCVQGAGISIWELLKSIADLSVWSAKYAFDVGATRQQATVVAKQQMDSINGYLSAEYQRAYDRTSTSDEQSSRERLAFLTTARSVANDLWRKFDDHVQTQLAEIQCLSPKESSKVKCELLTSAFFPPGGMMSLSSKGTKGLFGSTAALEAMQRELAQHGDELADFSHLGKPKSTLKPITTKRALCADCPTLTLNKDGRSHAAYHFADMRSLDSQYYSELLEEVESLGRLQGPARAQALAKAEALSRFGAGTSLFPPWVSIEKVMHTLDKGTDWKTLESNLPGRGVVRGNIEVEGVPGGATSGASGGRYKVVVTFCRERPCTSTDGRNYDVGDVISIQPVCGPGVVHIPRTLDVQRYRTSSDEPALAKSRLELRPCR